MLSACRPPLALAALEAEPSIGLLLPCKVVRALDDVTTAVGAVDPQMMVSMAEDPELQHVADAPLPVSTSLFTAFTATRSSAPDGPAEPRQRPAAANGPRGPKASSPLSSACSTKAKTVRTSSLSYRRQPRALDQAGFVIVATGLRSASPSRRPRAWTSRNGKAFPLPRLTGPSCERQGRAQAASGSGYRFPTRSRVVIREIMRIGSTKSETGADVGIARASGTRC
jgi:hypothetical protein